MNNISIPSGISAIIIKLSFYRRCKASNHIPPPQAMGCVIAMRISTNPIVRECYTRDLTRCYAELPMNYPTILLHIKAVLRNEMHRRWSRDVNDNSKPERHTPLFGQSNTIRFSTSHVSEKIGDW